MEKFIINRRNIKPKEEDIKPNINENVFKVFRKNNYYLKFSLKNNFILNVGDTILFRKISEDLVNDYGNTFENKFKIKFIETDVNNTTWYFIDFPERKELVIDKILFPKDENTEYKVIFNENHNLFQGEFWDEANINILDGNKETDDFKTAPNLKLMSIIDDEKVAVDGLYIYSDDFIEMAKIGLKTPDDSKDINSIYTKNKNITNIIPGTKCRFNGSDYLSHINYIEENGEIEYKLLGNTEVYKLIEYIEFPITINSDNGFNLNSEDLINTQYVNKIKDECIPETIDMEKVCFEPYMRNFGISFIPVKEIVIEPHFRKREGENWTKPCDYLKTNEKLKENNKGYVMKESTPTQLLDLNFTLDDVKYQKNRLKQSFIRLNFYDSNNIFDKQLLYYSTIFFDTGKAFGDYMRKTANGNYLPSLFLGNEFSEINSKFSVTDRYDFSKSSEGFYLYLFPSVIDDLKIGGIRNGISTIYMTIEFNHAGVGKTIPLVWNKDETIPYNYTKEENNGEIKLKSTDMNKYYEDLFIPINIQYNDFLKKYIYIFPKETLVKNENNNTGKVILRVFEPKMS